MNSRGNFLTSIPQVTRILLVVNVLVFLVNIVSKGIVNHYFALYSFNTGAFSPYQLITHMFAHGGIGHLFFNMFGVYMFGRAIEMHIGSKRFFILYFLSGLGAAGLQLLIYHLVGDPARMVGASGALFGILAAFALYFPNTPLMLIFLPIPIKAKYFVAIYAGIELFSGINAMGGGESQIAHFAHLGGAIVGFILVKIWKKNQFNIM